MKDRARNGSNKIMREVNKFIHLRMSHSVKVGDIEFQMSGIQFGSLLDKSLHEYGY